MSHSEPFSCYLVQRNEAGELSRAVAQCSVDDLPPGDVRIAVEFSSLNYKDALSATGHPGVTRKFPHVPGIDAAGRVLQSSSPDFKPDDAVLVTSYNLGTSHWGGFAGQIRVPANWLVPMPAGLDARASMIYGTAGFTAGLALETLQQRGLEPDQGEVLVTGASGGVGSMAVALLAQAGFSVVAVTGKPEAAEYLTNILGAARVIGRGEVDDQSNKPLLSAQWAGAVDTVGGNTLATVLRSTKPGGCVTACGLVGGAELPLTVYPFILRGIDLTGIDSAECPMPRRRRIWSQLAGTWKLPQLDSMVEETDLAGLSQRIDGILAGQVQGRVIVRP